MALITKPDMEFIWASGGAIVEPSDVKKQTGWTVEVPPHQFENWIQNRQDEYLAHINQRGIPQWDVNTEYEAGKSYAQGSNGTIYIALQTHTNQNPITDIGNVYWFPYQQQGILTFTYAGVTNWTVPLAMQLGIIKPKVTVIGAGGGGGAATSSANYNAAGGGGGAGGLAQELIDLTGVTSVSVTVGAGGAGGIAAGAFAQSGGSSSFGAYCSAAGGDGGNSATATVGNSQLGAGGFGGFGSGGGINGGGGSGQSGVISAFGVAGATAGTGKGGVSFYSGREGSLGGGGVGAATVSGGQGINGSAGAPGCVIIEW